MEHYAGIDVSLEESSVCVVDAKGNVLHEAKVKTEVEALGAWLKKWGVSYERVGLEAGPMSPWLFEGLSHLKLPAMCIETRRMKAFTSASPVKTDRKDARAIADAMRMGFFKMVHVKSRASLEARVLLTNRTLLVHQRIQQQNTIRGTLKTFGLKLGKVSQGRFVARVRELVAGSPGLEAVVVPMLTAWQNLSAPLRQLERQVVRLAKADPVCRLLMTAPGIGPVVALAYRTGLDIPQRFRKSRLVGVHLGLTPRKYASGQIDRNGPITKCGDAMVRGYLFEAANSILSRLRQPCALRDWAAALAERTTPKLAKVALARRLAVILHRMWMTNQPFNWAQAQMPATAQLAKAA